MNMSYDIKVQQGATFSLKIRIKDSNESPVDLTGLVFRGQIRKTVSDTEIQASFSFEILDQVTNTGEVIATISAGDTMDIYVIPSARAERKITKMAYDIESQDLDGVVVRWLQGVAIISPEATR